MINRWCLCVCVCVWGGAVGGHTCWSKEQNVWVLSGSCSHFCSPSKADGPVGGEGEGSKEWRGLSFHLSSADNLACSLDSGTQLPTFGRKGWRLNPKDALQPAHYVTKSRGQILTGVWNISSATGLQRFKSLSLSGLSFSDMY